MMLTVFVITYIFILSDIGECADPDANPCLNNSSDNRLCENTARNYYCYYSDSSKTTSGIVTFLVGTSFSHITVYIWIKRDRFKQKIRENHICDWSTTKKIFTQEHVKFTCKII